MLRLIRLYILPTLVCLTLTTLFWVGISYVRAARAEAAQKDQILLAIARIVDHNIKEGKLTLPPPESAAAKP